jgi:hypothetical protein
MDKQVYNLVCDTGLSGIAEDYAEGELTKEEVLERLESAREQLDASIEQLKKLLNVSSK